MSGAAGRVRRATLCTIIALAATTTYGVASAAAQITTTSITSPSSPFVYVFNGDATPSPQVTITGTTDATAPGSDQVDINCYESSSFYYNVQVVQIASNVTTNPDGTFSWTGPVNLHGATCQLRAVPAGYGATYPLTPFQSVLTEGDFSGTNHVNGAMSPQSDYLYTASALGASNGYDSVGNCGVYMTPLYPSTQSYVGYRNYGGWNCAGTLSASKDSGFRRSEIQIDGKNAYGSYDAASAYSDTINSSTVSSGQAAGFPAQSSSYTRAGNVYGDATITEGEGLVSCADASYPATEAKCGGSAGAAIGTWQSDGVSLQRATSQSHDGQVVSQSDTFTSTDGRAHTVDLEYDDSSGAGFEGTGVAWELPGSPSAQIYSAEDTATLAPGSTNAIVAQSALIPASAYAPDMSIVYHTQPNSVRFVNYGEMLVKYTRTIPAGGSITISQDYVAAADSATTHTLTNGIVDQTIKPQVSITSPANATRSSVASVAVAGRAFAHDGLTLKVNGQAVGVNPDGTWATTIALTPGENLVSAIVSDGSGNTAQAQEDLIYAPAATPRYCIVPGVAHKTLGQARAAVRRANCRVGRIRHVRSITFRKGRVEHASYGYHAVLVSGTKVGLTVSSGRPKRRHRHHHLLVLHHGFRA